MTLHARLKKLEAKRRPVHVVDSHQDYRAACEAFGVRQRPPQNLLRPRWTDAPDSDEPYPPTYDELRGAGAIVETERYVAALRADAERASTNYLNLIVSNWRSGTAYRPRQAYGAARDLRRLLNTPTPGDYGSYRPGCMEGLMGGGPPMVVVAKRHDGAHEAAAWADRFERDHPEEVAVWEREREAEREQEARRRAESRRRLFRREGRPYEPEDYDAAHEAVGPADWPEPRTPRSDRIVYEAWAAEVEFLAGEIARARGYVNPASVSSPEPPRAPS